MKTFLAFKHHIHKENGWKQLKCTPAGLGLNSKHYKDYI